MNEVRQILTQAKNLNIHISGDVSKLATDGYKPQTVWSKMVAQDSKKEGPRYELQYNE